MIEPGYFWLNVFLLAIGTLAIRFSIIAMSAKVRINNRVRELFSFIPAAILPAFVAPAIFLHHGSVASLYGKERLLVLIAATAVTFFTRSTLATIVFGLVALFLLTAT